MIFQSLCSHVIRLSPGISGDSVTTSKLGMAMTTDSGSNSPGKHSWLSGLGGSDFNMLLLILFTMKLRCSEHPERKLIGVFRFLTLSFLPVVALLYVVTEVSATQLLPRLVAIAYSIAFVTLMMAAPIDGLLIRQFVGVPGIRGAVRPAIGAALFGCGGVFLLTVPSHGLWNAVSLWFAAFLSCGLTAALYRSARHAQPIVPGDAAQ